jgi:hypothetical protein
MAKSVKPKPSRTSDAPKPQGRQIWRTIHLILATLFLLAGVFYLLRYGLLIATPRAYRFCLIGSAFAGFGLGFAWWWRQPVWEAQDCLLENSRKQIGVLSAAAVFILCFTIWCGLSQIGGFDHSVLIDLAWRMIHGQVPYKDFPCTLPPGFYLGAFYAFKLFGAFWQSMIIAQAIFAAFAFVWIYWLLSRILKNRMFALLIAFSSQAISTMLVAYWWYNPVTAISAVIFVLSCAVWILYPDLLRPHVSFFLSLILLALMKPNIGGPLIVGCVLILLTSKPHRWRTILLSASAFLVFISIFLVHHLSVEQMLESYRQVAERGFSSRLLQDARVNETRFVQVLFVLLFSSFLARNGCAQLRRGSRLHGLFIFGASVGVYGFFTNGENTLVDCPLALVGGALFASLPGEISEASLKKSSFWIRYCGFVALFVTCVGLGEAVMRTRVKEIGYGLFYDYATVKNTDGGFFKNARYSDMFKETKSEVANALDTLSKRIHRPVKDLRIFFGPRMQWAYAAFDLESPADLPIWWHPGVAFAAKDEKKYILEWRKTDFDAVILLRAAGATYLSSEFQAAMRDNFATDNSYPNILLMLPRQKLANPEAGKSAR